MIIYNEFHDVEKPQVYHNKYGDYSDDIYCFDIETTNLFNINGEWQQFDKSIKDYKNIDMASCVYHCQFSVNDKVYGFRHINELEDILKAISNPLLCKVVWVHNLNFEFQHIMPILKKYTITNMIARKTRMPICFHIEELNIDFRCSLRLTELSLERSSEQYTNVKKAKGDLDYNKSRHPLTPLTEKEQYYCEMDCICLYEIIKYFRKQYKHVRSIPYTQTGRVRRAMKEISPKSHFNFIKKHTPTVEEYKLLSKYVFMGGISHANPLHVRDYITKQHSFSKDIASSYPTQMTTKRFPMDNFAKIKIENDHMYPMTHYCKIYDVILTAVKSKMYNHYISFSKCFDYENEYVDNGRLVSADKVHIIVTDIDYEMIKKCYKFEPEIQNIYVARNDYLPKWMIQFILKNYGDKTKLKGIEGSEDIYLNAKQIINCVYG